MLKHLNLCERITGKQTFLFKKIIRRHLRIINSNKLPDCPLTRDEIMEPEDIFGANLGYLRRKKTRKSSTSEMTKRLGIPPEIQERSTNIIL